MARRSRGGCHPGAILDSIRERYGAELEGLRTSLSPLTQLEWTEGGARESAYVALKRPSHLGDEATWPDIDAWKRQAAEGLHALFSPVVRTLDANLPEPTSTDGTLPE